MKRAPKRVKTSMIPSNRGFIDYCAEGLERQAEALERDAREATDPGQRATLGTVASLLRQSAEAARAARKVLAKDVAL